MALILNIETSADYCSVSLAETGKIIDTLIEKKERSHASLLAVSIEKLIKRNKLSIQNLNAVAISKGPGSYTGLRIGTSTAKGICYGINIPLIAIDTLKAMSWGAKQELGNSIIENEIQFCPMLDARRMEIYTALYDVNLNTISEARPVILDEETIQEFDNSNFVFFGSGIEKFKTLVNINENRFINEFVPTSDYLAELSFDAYQNQEFVDTAYFEPFYLKEFIATTPKRKVL